MKRRCATRTCGPCSRRFKVRVPFTTGPKSVNPRCQTCLDKDKAREAMVAKDALPDENIEQYLDRVDRQGWGIYA